MKQKLLLLLTFIGLSVPNKADEIRFDNDELHLTFMLNETTKEATVGTGLVELANAIKYPPLGDPWWNMNPQPNYWNDINIPETIVYGGETYTVTEIAPYAFYKTAGMQHVKLPETIRVIGSSAFSWCAHLETINIPDGVSVINSETFKLCRKLKSIELPSSVVWIGSSAFGDCDGLESITIPGNCKNIGDDAFRWCEKLHKVIFEDGEETLRLGCGRTISILYSSVDQLNDESWKNGDDLRDHPRGLFADCKLDTIYLGRNITYPYEDKWRSIHTEGSLPYGVQWPVVHLFPFVQSSKYDASKYQYYEYSPKLKLLEFGEGLTEIPDSLFMDATINCEITLPQTLKKVGTCALYLNKYSETQQTELIIPEFVEYIGLRAFNINVRSIICNPVVPPEGPGQLDMAYVPLGSGPAYRQKWPGSHIIDFGDDWVTVNVKTAGSLYSRLLAQDIQLSNIYRLKLKGTINDEDIEVLNNMYMLYDLDLSELKMKELPPNIITNKRLIVRLKLPSVLEKINDNEFKNFIHLGGTIEIPTSCISVGDFSFYNTLIEELNYTGTKVFGEGAFSSVTTQHPLIRNYSAPLDTDSR